MIARSNHQSLLVVTAVCFYAAALLFSVSTAAQQNYPVKPVELYVGASPGGPSDTIARTVADGLSKRLGQTFFVSNISGAAGIIVIQQVARAPADGYKILLVTDLNASALLDARPQTGIDLSRNFVPIAFLGAIHDVLVVKSDAPWKSLNEFLLAAKEKTLAGFAGDTRTRILLTALSRATKTRLEPVPFAGINSSLNELVERNVSASVVPLPSAVPLIKSGSIRALATFGSRRVTGFEGIPTAKEQKVPLVIFNGYGLLAPAGTPSNVIQTLEKSAAAVVNNSETRTKLLAQGFDFSFAAGRAYGAYLAAAEIQKGGGGGAITTTNCDKCTSDVCQSPPDDCKVCCQQP